MASSLSPLAQAGVRTSMNTSCAPTQRRSERAMIIDWHTHVHSLREQAAPFWRGQCPATIDNVLRLHDEVGLDISVISNSGHYLKACPREEALPAIREANECLALVRDKHKDKIVALAV